MRKEILGNFEQFVESGRRMRFPLEKEVAFELVLFLNEEGHLRKNLGEMNNEEKGELLDFMVDIIKEEFREAEKKGQVKDLRPSPFLKT